MSQEIVKIINDLRGRELSAIDAYKKITSIVEQTDRARLSDCWDAAIIAYRKGGIDNRSHDNFDEYYNELIKNK